MVMDRAKIDNMPECRIENNIIIGPKVEFKPKYKGVAHAMFDTLKRNADAIGQIDAVTGATDRYGDMLDRSVKCALWMKKQGIRSGDVVVVSSHNHLDVCVPCIASTFLGAIFCTWDFNINTESGSHFLKVSDPKIIFANETATAVCSEVLKLQRHTARLVVFGEHPAAVPFSETLQGHSDSDVSSFRYTQVDDLRHPVMIVFSSGTTGLPKGVEIPQLNVLYIDEMGEPLDLHGKTSFWFSPVSWISGALLQFQAILHRSPRVVASEFDVDTTWQFIERYKVGWMFIGTSMLHRLGKAEYPTKYDVSSLKYTLTGGAGLKREAQAELRKHFSNFTIVQAFGMTEVGGICASQTADSTDGSVGFPVINGEVKVVDPDTEKILGPNQPGEFRIKMPTLTTGYYKNPEATKKLIDAEGWLYTGDLGYYTESGEMFIIERLKEIIKYRGNHVPPGILEPLLQSHSAVLEASVVGLPHPIDDEWPMAFVSVVPGRQVTEQELVDLVANKSMDSYKLRGGVKFLESLPHTASGKINRKELKQMAKSIAAVRQ